LFLFRPFVKQTRGTTTKKRGCTIGITVGQEANRHGMMTDIMEWTPHNDREEINKQEWVNSALKASRRTEGERRF